MKIALFLVCLLACSQASVIEQMFTDFRLALQKVDFQPLVLTPRYGDFRNGSYNISQFIQGFAYGAYEERVEDLTHCINDNWDLAATLIRDFKPILNGTNLERAAAISDLMWHLVRDLPDAVGTCGHLGNKTMEVIYITEALFKEMVNFKHILHALVGAMGPVIKYVVAASSAFEKGNWYGAGENVGKIFRAILDYPETAMVDWR
jgi:hypothetical protein